MRPVVAVEKVDRYDLDKAYSSITDLLAKIKFSFRQEQKVLLKPNILSENRPEQHITTHPIIVEAVIRIVKEQGAVPVIGESSGFYQDGGTRAAFKVSGIADVAQRHGAKIITFEESGSVHVEDDCSQILKSFNLASPVIEADCIVSLPKLKTHTLMQYTGAVKNMFGTIPGGQKQQCHVIAGKPKDFAKLLFDIYTHAKPDLNIMDGIIGLEGNGPGTAGKPKQCGVLIASTDGIALDVIAQKIIGLDPKSVPTTAEALRRGLLRSIDDIDLIGDAPDVKFKRPVRGASIFPSFVSGWVFSRAIATPFVDEKRCRRCNRCVKVCPVGAMKGGAYPRVDIRKCIHCYCCHEMCPHDAIDMKQSLLFRTAKYIKDMMFPIQPKERTSSR